MGWNKKWTNQSSRQQQTSMENNKSCRPFHADPYTAILNRSWLCVDVVFYRFDRFTCTLCNGHSRCAKNLSKFWKFYKIFLFLMGISVIIISKKAKWYAKECYETYPEMKLVTGQYKGKITLHGLTTRTFHKLYTVMWVDVYGSHCILFNMYIEVFEAEEVCCHQTSSSIHVPTQHEPWSMCDGNNFRNFYVMG